MDSQSMISVLLLWKGEPVTQVNKHDFLGVYSVLGIL